MPEIKFIQKVNELGIKITEPEAEIIKGEIDILSRSMEASKKVFNIKLQDTVSKLYARDMSEEQIVNMLLDDLENDGPLFGGLKRQLIGDASGMTESTIKRLDAEIMFDESGEEQQTWIAILVNTCPDCLPRHGFTKSYNEWLDLGLPGSGWSVCKSHCQCQLFPASVVEQSRAELTEPLRRVKGKITAIAKDKEVVNVGNYVNRKLGSINNTADPIRSEYRKLLPGFKK